MTVFNEFDLDGDSQHNKAEFANVWTDFCAEKCNDSTGMPMNCICDGVNYEDVFKCYNDDTTAEMTFNEFDILFWDMMGGQLKDLDCDDDSDGGDGGDGGDGTDGGEQTDQ
jgi:hypothetical protein